MTKQKTVSLKCECGNRVKLSDEQLRNALVQLQWKQMIDKPKDGKVVDKGAYWCLVSEDRDLLPIMQCLQDHGVFKVNPERPPFAEFAQWLETNHVPLFLIECDEMKMSRAHRKLAGARYPWKNTHMHENILMRWRVMYQMLAKMLEEMA